MNKHPTHWHYDELYISQAGKCAWCGGPLGSGKRRDHIDHNHRCCPGPETCGKCVRGLVHPYCNTNSITAADRKFVNGKRDKLTNLQRDYLMKGEPDEPAIAPANNLDDPFKRFSRQVANAVYRVNSYHRVLRFFRDDVRQEALIRLASYAGLLEKPIWGNGNLQRWSEQVNGDEDQLKALVTHNLIRDLSQILRRQTHKDRLPVGPERTSFYRECVFSAEDEYLRESEYFSQEDELRAKYPYFTAQVFDRLSIAELTKLGSRRISRSSVCRKLREEKSQFLRSRGIK